MGFVKITIQTILVICMIIAIIFGVVDIFKLSVDLGQEVLEGEILDSLGIWRDHLGNIVMSGIGLAVTWIGWKEAQEYFDEDKDVKIYRG